MRKLRKKLETQRKKDHEGREDSRGRASRPLQQERHHDRPGWTRNPDRQRDRSRQLLPQGVIMTFLERIAEVSGMSPTQLQTEMLESLSSEKLTPGLKSLYQQALAQYTNSSKKKEIPLPTNVTPLRR